MNLPFLRIPPFPGHRAPDLAAEISSVGAQLAIDPGLVAERLRATRVGGSFWGAQPSMAAGLTVLAPQNRAQLAAMLQEEPPADSLVCAPRDWLKGLKGTRLRTIDTVCDPWWIAAHAGTIWAGADNELALVARLADVPLRTFGEGRFAHKAGTALECLARELAGRKWRDPFTGRPIGAPEAIDLLVTWRQLIDSNRCNSEIYGIARWKRQTVNALLWDGTGPVRYGKQGAQRPHPLARPLVWKSRTAPADLARLAQSPLGTGEVEDGFIRSAGLGANCVPPLSIIVDFSGIYFDPSAPSDLETMLENETLDPSLVARASALRQRLIASSISKYGNGGSITAAPAGKQRKVLVTGQVEDDRSIHCGGFGATNLQLIKQARLLEPDAWIIYKPHPDVEAGHRRGQVPDAEALRHVDEIQRDAPIIPLIEAVDALHVITSLAGFEALLRGKEVTTHGVPFYAGWGLTNDLGPVPARRTRRRSLDELVAATLLLYPRYLDPVTRLPCPAEVLVERLATGQAAMSSPLITLRQWQGRLRKTIGRMRGRA